MFQPYVSFAAHSTVGLLPWIGLTFLLGGAIWDHSRTVWNAVAEIFSIATLPAQNPGDAIKITSGVERFLPRDAL